MAFIVSSVYYNLPVNTGSFYSRGGLLFFGESNCEARPKEENGGAIFSKK